MKSEENFWLRKKKTKPGKSHLCCSKDRLPLLTVYIQVQESCIYFELFWNNIGMAEWYAYEILFFTRKTFTSLQFPQVLQLINKPNLKVKGL